MRAEDVRRFLQTRPFEPIRVGLSDGRSVLIRHPDQAVVSNRYLLVGVTEIGRSKPLVTPESSDTVAREAFWVNLLQVVSVKPDDAAAA
ncbi:MAG: hypothetical protein ACYS15_09130 [Planctomycetota bacterium]|jgi:hypothetical protein